MNLISYIDKYGDKTFNDMPFNEVDNAIFASLSYVSFIGIVSSTKRNKITIREASDKYFTIHPGKQRYVLAVKQAVKMLKNMADTKRYGNLYLYNYVYETTDEQQFSAMTIEINPKLVYISFEGTDHLVSGWKEDFMMTYKFPVASQRQAINYVNRRFIFDRKEIILGGHSKGGNLAMVAGMYANMFVRNKIIKIYNNDGPGLLKEYYESKNYANIKDKLVHIVPNYGVVGLLLHHSDDYIVVRSTKKNVLCHDVHTWVVLDNSFMRGILDSYSKMLDAEIIKWLNKYTRDERERFVLAMFDIFDRAKIDSLIDVLDNKVLIFDLINEYKELDDIDIKMLKDFIRMLFKCFKEVKIEEIKKKFEKKDDKIEV